jgi:DNA-binding LytR/AlgR family response regulator
VRRTVSGHDYLLPQISTLERQLEIEQFQRIHRSHCPRDHGRGLRREGGELLLLGELSMRIGRKYRRRVKAGG